MVKAVKDTKVHEVAGRGAKAGRAELIMIGSQ